MFSNRIVNNWNNLLEWVVSAETVKTFQSRLDQMWKDQEQTFNYEAQLATRATTQTTTDRGENYMELESQA